MKIRLLLGLAWTVGLLVAACGTPPKEQEVLSVVYRQVDAINKEDLKAFMATQDPQSNDFEENRRNTQDLFDRYKLNAWIESARVVSLKGDRAEIEASIITKAVSGDGFVNSRTLARHFLRHVDGKWLVTSSKPIRVEPLP